MMRPTWNGGFGATPASAGRRMLLLFLAILSLCWCISTSSASSSPTFPVTPIALPTTSTISAINGYVLTGDHTSSLLRITVNGQPASGSLFRTFFQVPSSNTQQAQQQKTPQQQPQKQLYPRVEFHLMDLKPGVYLLEFFHPAFLFPRYQVHIDSDGTKGMNKRNDSFSTKNVAVYQVNEYMQPVRAVPLPLEVSPTEPIVYFAPPTSFNIWSFLRQPMVLIGLLMMLFMWCIPKLQQQELEGERMRQQQLLMEQQQLQQQQLSRQQRCTNNPTNFLQEEYGGPISPFVEKAALM